MFFTEQGQCYWLKVHEIGRPPARRAGKPILSCVAMSRTSGWPRSVPVREFSEDQFLLFATKDGVVKKDRTLGIRESALGRHSGDQISKRATS